MKGKNVRILGMAIVVSLITASSAYADAFNDLRYTFSSSTGNQLAALGGPSSGDLTALDITDTHASMAASSSGNNFYFNGLVNEAPGTPVNYLTWTLTVDAGAQLDLAEVKFDYWNEQASGFGVSYALRSSLDGFTSNLASVESYLVSDQASLTADLDALGTTFEGLTGSIDFRIYTYGDVAFNASSERGRLDSIYHTGETSVIPEPATMGLVAVFGGAVLFIRRRFMI